MVSASCFFFPATLEEVIRIIKDLKNKGSKVLDIHPTVIKENLFLFGKHFVILYNLSVETAIFPNLIKIARACPIFKSGKPEVIDNYRPISSLPDFF